MTSYYLDTSAFVKRYFPEVGSLWILHLTFVAADDDLINAAIAEGLSAIHPNHYPYP